MKTSRVRSLLLLLMTVTVTGTAASLTPPLSVQDDAVLLPPPDTRCTLSVTNRVVDYGTLSRWQMEEVAAAGVSPGVRSLAVSVACPYTRIMKLRVEGEPGGAGGLRFGERGTTKLRLMDAQLDGSPVMLRAVTQAGTVAERNDVALSAGDRLTPVVQGRPAEGRTLTARLEVQPVLPEGDARVSRLERSETLLTLTLDD